MALTPGSRSAEPATLIRFDLIVSLWAGRLLLMWLLVYPVYALFASSPLLQTTDADARLFTPGAEQLISLASAQVERLSSVLAAMTLLAVVAAGCALLASTISWVSLSRAYSIRDSKLWLECLALLPRFAGIGAAWLVIVFGLVTIWWELLPAYGGALVPLLGERRTDFCHLLTLALLAAALGASFVVADLVRALSIAMPTLNLFECARSGLVLFRSRLMSLLTQAACRFFIGVVLQAANVWLIGRLGWLASPHPYWILACLTTEAAALSTIWLRLKWMAWVRNLVVSAAQSTT